MVRPPGRPDFKRTTVELKGDLGLRMVCDITNPVAQSFHAEVHTCHSQCSLCTGPPEALDASNARREEIHLLEDRVIEIARTGEYTKAVEAAERMFSLIEEEDLTMHMREKYEVSARLYYHVGNLEKALEYTLKVRHEINAYGVPGKLGEEKLEKLEGIMARIEKEIDEKKGARSKSHENESMGDGAGGRTEGRTGTDRLLKR
jgi:hypothetical protein